MDKGIIERALGSLPWGKNKLDEAARGLVNGSCDDPPDVQLKFWVELARDELGDGTPAFLKRVEELKNQALRGEFK